MDVEAAKLAAAIALLERVDRRVGELSSLARHLDERTAAAIGRLSEVGAFDPADDAHIKRFATAMQLAKALSLVLRAKLFGEDGAENVALDSFLERLRREFGEAA